MALPHPKIGNIIPFRNGVGKASDAKAVGKGARLMNTTEGNFMVLFEKMPNNKFLKWEQIQSPIYCFKGVDRKTMNCDVNVM